MSSKDTANVPHEQIINRHKLIQEFRTLLSRPGYEPSIHTDGVVILSAPPQRDNNIVPAKLNVISNKEKSGYLLVS